MWCAAVTWPKTPTPCTRPHITTGPCMCYACWWLGSGCRGWGACTLRWLTYVCMVYIKHWLKLIENHEWNHSCLMGGTPINLCENWLTKSNQRPIDMPWYANTICHWRSMDLILPYTTLEEANSSWTCTVYRVQCGVCTVWDANRNWPSLQKALPVVVKLKEGGPLCRALK